MRWTASALVWGCAALTTAAVAAPGRAHACGGTFCDAGPSVMPVEQTGETILFVIDESFIEAHIQIQYDPSAGAERFAWIVPVTAVPELAVASQPLFDRLLSATVPTFGRQSVAEPCADDDADPGDPCADDDEWGEKLDVGGGGSSGSPQVVEHRIVGAFELFVLDGGTAEGVMTWLDDNGFAQDPAAEPILAEYLAADHLFVAFKLAPDADASEIHPIMLRYEGREPCVPIRLTRIAAQDDLEIRALFLADDRVAPTNFAHVHPNLLWLDWIGLGANYRELVALAIDEAGGHGFVTEYAGPSTIVGGAPLADPRWQPAAFVKASSEDALALLREQGLWACDDFTAECDFASPLLREIVATFLPPPDDVDANVFYGCPPCSRGQTDPRAWDGPAFAAALEERIVAPARHADALLARWPSLTRLYTTISPHEMTVDPMFHPAPSLPSVTLTSRTATLATFCAGPATTQLPGGLLVATPDPSAWPTIDPMMPRARLIEQIPQHGAPIVVEDHTDAITAMLASWNREHGPARPPAAFACDDDRGAVAASIAGDDADRATDAGCGCTTAPPLPRSMLPLLIIGGGVLLRRRCPC